MFRAIFIREVGGGLLEAVTFRKEVCFGRKTVPVKATASAMSLGRQAYLLRVQQRMAEWIELGE